MQRRLTPPLHGWKGVEYLLAPTPAEDTHIKWRVPCLGLDFLLAFRLSQWCAYGCNFTTQKK